MARKRYNIFVSRLLTFFPLLWMSSFFIFLVTNPSTPNYAKDTFISKDFDPVVLFKPEVLPPPDKEHLIYDAENHGNRPVVENKNLMVPEVAEKNIPINQVVPPNEPAAVHNEDTQIRRKFVHYQNTGSEIYHNLSGPGEMGSPVVIDPDKLTPEQRKVYEEGMFKLYNFNNYVSELISLHRSLPEVIPHSCEAKVYPDALPDTSVIICFYNEAWTTLLRTVHSVFDRSPPELLTEVILVDDFSNLDHLKKPLEDYLVDYPKVKVVRTTKREGLIRARLLGAAKSTGAVLTYLDSHVECFPGWLPPLLARIALNATNVVCPLIETISDTDFSVRNTLWQHIGGFDWDMMFNWKPIPQNEHLRRSGDDSEIIRSPTMAGGLFSIDREFFEYLGTYDPAFDVWGGENLELSFKTWMCGGTLEFVPCSKVAHVFRSSAPYSFDKENWNSLRLAEVWMDDYKEIFYGIGNFKMPEGIDVSARKALREKLQCKSFDWYMKNVYPDQARPKRFGAFRNIGSNMCLDTHAGRFFKEKSSKITGHPCHGKGGAQFLILTQLDEILKHDACLDSPDGVHTEMMPCHGRLGNQQWVYNQDDLTLRHVPSQKCLTYAEELKGFKLEPCIKGNALHQWQLPPVFNPQ